MELQLRFDRMEKDIHELKRRIEMLEKKPNYHAHGFEDSHLHIQSIPNRDKDGNIKVER